MRPLVGALVFLGLATAAPAEDFVSSEGPLGDDAFYRLVACAAPRGGACAKPFLRWSKDDITVGIVARSAPFLGGKVKRAEAAVVRALQHLNGAGMRLRLRAQDTAPDIAVYLLDTARGDTIESSGTAALDGLKVVNAVTTLEVREKAVVAAWIGFSRDMPIRQYESVMLEEIAQALGLVTDIRNPYYDSRSIFSQDADNSLKTLGAQDRVALQRHYPPR